MIAFSFNHSFLWILLSPTWVSAASASESLRPKFARVDGSIETVWQLPPQSPRGLLFIAHGCNHQGTDMFALRGSDSWEFPGCSASLFGTCLGLPEEMEMRRIARSRGYVVMAVSGGWGMKSCWDMDRDPPRVAAAIRHVLLVESLDAGLPILATGASSGGAFMGPLVPVALAMALNLKCIVPQIMGLPAVSEDRVPVLFIHMPRDQRTAARVEQNLRELHRRGTRAEQILVHPVPITAQFLTRGGLEIDQAAAVVEALRQHDFLDERGYLREDPRRTRWQVAVRQVIPDSVDTLIADESALSELLNVAWARHEFVSQHTQELIDFCEVSGLANETGRIEL